MKIYTSYFYQVRNFKPHMIPLSTAMWDPKWFHNFKGQGHVFFDKNHVVNGLRLNDLVPMPQLHGTCSGREQCELQPQDCKFLKFYKAQLDAIDFDKFMEMLEFSINSIKALAKLDEEPVVMILVHEAPDNVCSERGPIQQWFAEHGVEVTEFNPEEYSYA